MMYSAFFSKIESRTHAYTQSHIIDASPLRNTLILLLITIFIKIWFNSRMNISSVRCLRIGMYLFFYSWWCIEFCGQNFYGKEMKCNRWTFVYICMCLTFELSRKRPFALTNNLFVVQIFFWIVLNVCPFEGNGFIIYGAMINVLDVLQYVFSGLNHIRQDIRVQNGESVNFFENLVKKRFWRFLNHFRRVSEHFLRF